MNLTQLQVQKLLTYNPITGDLTWNVRDVSMFKDKRSCKSWNTRYSGKCAGTNGLFNGKWYIAVRILGVSYLAHRVIWLYVTGVIPDEIDHEDSDGLNNTWFNLRNVTHQENCKNTRMGKSNTSGTVGVHWCNRDQRWVARIQVDGKTKSVGYFKNKQDAIYARLQSEQKYGYHENHGTQSNT